MYDGSDIDLDSDVKLKPQSIQTCVLKSAA